MSDLIGAALTDREPAAQAAMADRQAGRLAAIKADIEARLGRRDLGADGIATLHGVSPRVVQKLFEAEGRTFSDYVLERRLDRAWHQLVTAKARHSPSAPSPMMSASAISPISTAASAGDSAARPRR